MKKSDILKICDDFSVNPGQKKCLYLDTDMCTHPDHFRCAVKLHNESTMYEFKDILNYAKCPRFYDYTASGKHPDNLKAYRENDFFKLGLQYTHEGKDQSFTDHGLEEWRKIRLEQVMFRYGKDPFKFDSAPVTIKTIRNKKVIRYFLDGLRGSEAFIFKFASRDIDQRSIGLEAAFILGSVSNITNVNLVIIKKAITRFTDKDTTESFTDKVANKYRQLVKSDDFIRVKKYDKFDFVINKNMDYFYKIHQYITDNLEKNSFYRVPYTSCRGCNYHFQCNR